ncbi:cytochrome C oxidase subunit IV family protein [Ruegeria lacuscaerulensis]|uniref:cytochrome C oxidase subunit IV family protein n=1 Tax=Ruegeria lacuscaerulensis TaxID=55218 RepID=UPI00147C1E07|nr:cytochrome C oxidase subunit IV family protein [Ruegeria lacuscaerulensis]
MSALSSCSKYGRRRLLNPLTRTWVALLALTVASALLIPLPIPRSALAAAILLLALIKSRLILARYLDLAHSPAWLRGFSFGLICFAVVLFGLYLI